jgi:uncharacterized membrane protein YhiD involved in acid resistance
MNNTVDTLAERFQAGAVNLISVTTASTAEIVTALLTAFVCGLIIAWTYRTSFQGVLYQYSYFTSLVLASVITATVIMIISGNLVLSLGLVGALSIIRFRTAVKDPLDTIFMFWAMTAGIANGIGYLKMGIISTLTISAIVFALDKFPRSKNPQILIVNFSVGSEDEISEILRTETSFFETVSSSINNNLKEAVYRIKANRGDDVLGKLQSMQGVKDAKILHY